MLSQRQFKSLLKVAPPKEDIILRSPISCQKCEKNIK